MVCGNTSQHNNTTHHFRFSLPTLPLPPDAPSPCSPLHPLSLSLYPRLNINEKYEGKRLVLRQPGIQGGREGGEGRGDLSACLDILEVVDAFLLLRGMGNVPGIARLHLTVEPALGLFLRRELSQVLQMVRAVEETEVIMLTTIGAAVNDLVIPAAVQLAVVRAVGSVLHVAGETVDEHLELLAVYDGGWGLLRSLQAAQVGCRLGACGAQGEHGRSQEKETEGRPHF